MWLDVVSERKREYVEWSKGFRAWVARQREAQASEFRERLAEAVQGARAEGASVSEIMRAYGTTDRKTVNDLLETRLLHEVLPLQDFTVSDGFVVNDRTGESVAFEVDDTPMGWYPYVDGEAAETELGRLVNDPDSVVHKEAKRFYEDSYGG